MHREGYVVQFQVDGSDSWVGNFQPGVGTFCGIVRNANSILVTVIAGGQAYVVDPASGDLARQFGVISICACPFRKCRPFFFRTDFGLN